MKNSNLYVFEDETCGGIFSYEKKNGQLIITVVSRPKQLKLLTRLKIGLTFFLGFLRGSKNIETSVVIDRKQAAKVRRYLNKRT